MSFRVGLQSKVVIGLLVIALVPLIVSASVVREVAIVAQSVAIGEAERLGDALDRARLAYVEAIEARKAAFRDAAARIASDRRLAAACAAPEPSTASAELARLVRGDRWLGSAALAFPDGRTITVERDLAVEGRQLPFDASTFALPLRDNPACAVTAIYVSDRADKLREDFEHLGDLLKDHRDLAEIRRRLPPDYRRAFLILVGGFVAGLTAIGIVVARRTTKRIDRLVHATRRVAGGDLDSRVDVRGRDELGDLARAFDDMIVELRRSRAEIEYLHKIGAWQEVARRLAHEIKNPLTPIQLAVQQLHTKYGGEDPRFRRMLDEANEIVTEEIEGLRRLVDAFSGFAKLPRVEPKPLDLATVVDDVARDLPVEIDPPPSPVTIAGDRMLLRRVLVNLVENARQAGASRVRVSWRGGDVAARLTVDDDGPGVPAPLREKLFDPYVTTKPHGTGLGLAIVKKTILEHAGEITLADSSPLGGARFEIVLPFAARS